MEEEADRILNDQFENGEKIFVSYKLEFRSGSDLGEAVVIGILPISDAYNYDFSSNIKLALVEAATNFKYSNFEFAAKKLALDEMNRSCFNNFVPKGCELTQISAKLYQKRQELEMKSPATIRQMLCKM